ncbi:DUF3025 domain-containing protein [Chitinimonas sp. BJYL2]|uniref:DUF3025 domain-containing protein n=1 Tax=Chitinimonas sp. BJYL2 TaxID=2976696 RepID=UPI0022B2FDD4|nr:DUF3025 domain-containing protein [Chitinimonas sp. BJYL2]
MDWPLDHFAGSPWLLPLRPTLRQLGWQHFPTTTEWAALPDELRPRTRSGKPVRFVLPDEATIAYEARIARHGEVLTRPDNWHDLFNALCWLAWPRSKAALNALHLVELDQQTGTLRSPARDAATLLDESGVVLAVADTRLQTALLAHDWQTLFVTGRAQWGRSIQAMPIGHALMEKSLAPFVGIVAKAALMPVSPDWFSLPPAQQIHHADVWLAAQIDQRRFNKPRDLPALPVLGIPGWWPQQCAAFYADTHHFRPKRHVVRPG